MFEEPETYFIGKDGEMVVLEDLACLDDFFSEGGMFFVDSGGDAFELVAEYSVVVDHCGLLF